MASAMRITGATLPDQQTANTTSFDGYSLEIATTGVPPSNSEVVRPNNWFSNL
jgi:hypothetical protein